MDNSAEVRSLSQLQNLRERLAVCRGQSIKEAEALQTEIARLTRWLEDEATAYWQQQSIQAQRCLNECRDALLRCQATVRGDEKRSCTDERKRVERATERKNLCDAKLRALREACLVWQKQVVKLRGRLQHVADMADSDLLVTLGELDRIIGTLETYARLKQ